MKNLKTMKKDNLKLVTVDETKCVKCCACVKICPMGVIGISGSGFPEPESFAYRLCINCGYCVDVCAYGALIHSVRKRSLVVLKRERSKSNGGKKYD